MIHFSAELRPIFTCQNEDYFLLAVDILCRVVLANDDYRRAGYRHNFGTSTHCSFRSHLPTAADARISFAARHGSESPSRRNVTGLATPLATPGTKNWLLPLKCNFCASFTAYRRLPALRYRKPHRRGHATCCWRDRLCCRCTEFRHAPPHP